MAKVKALMTISQFGIVLGATYDLEFNDQFKASMVENHIAKYVANDEVKQSEVDDYQEKQYPNNFLVIKDNALFRADVGEGNFTSATWVYSTVNGEPSEWVLKIQGA